MRKILSFPVLTFLLIFLSAATYSGEYARQIQWKGVVSYPSGDGTMYSVLEFEGSSNTIENNYLPWFYEGFALENENTEFAVHLAGKIFEPVPENILSQIKFPETTGTDIKVSSYTSYNRKQPYAIVTFFPFRENEITGQLEWLTRFKIIIDEYPGKNSGSFKQVSTYKNNSVLASGNWYKIAVDQTGVQKITYNDLSAMGINPSSINPKNIRIYGNGGGMLPEAAGDFRYDGLQENAILVSGENDGSFDPNDYILFYGESPNQWRYSPEDEQFHYDIHLYSDYNYYFITTDLGPGKRIAMQPVPGGSPNHFITTFNDAIHYEVDKINLIKSGRIWYGETFDLFNDLIKQYTISNLDQSSKVVFTASAAARSDVSSSFSFYINNQEKLHLAISNTNSNNPNSNYARAKIDSTSFYPGSNSFTVKVRYNKSLPSSVGYLDYFTLNFTRHLAFSDGQMNFRNAITAAQELVSKYTLTKANADIKVWNVTDPINVKSMETSLSGAQLMFTSESTGLQEFVAFDGTSFHSPEFIGTVANQNLHGTGNYDMIIITYQGFADQAERLAQFHRNFDGFNVFVVEPEQIYNEFSSGAQDITAIRDFMKMLYDKAEPGNEPKYLLLFGDASYDPKNRIENNTNFIPSWESPESLNTVSSYVKDDYYGYLDNGKDQFLDIGIGRFVVSTAEQAKNAVDKVIRYAVNTPENLGDWRNIICLIADDEDGNLHFNQAEQLASMIDTVNKSLNIDKIYLDAYKQVSTPSGARYPDVTHDITSRVERGALIVNYTGHGGEGGLAHERILKVSDIENWRNPDQMPVFITATCEFSRFDDPERVSAGELVVLNPNGGGIAMFTTTRATYSSPNFTLNKGVYKYALNKTNGQYNRMGDIIRLAKNDVSDVTNKSKFSLLGDPALRFAFPEQKVVTAKINSVSITDETDTIRALSKVKISGEMQNSQGVKLTDFNGILYPTVYDKPAQYRTLGNDEASNPASFTIQKNPLYKGKASVTNGDWEFEFIAPKDIAYQYGKGKLSYYAHNGVTDAAGYFNDVIIGGYNIHAESDEKGPAIRLFINDTNFVFGGLTDENPNLIAYLYDQNGINTVGNGIGHDILATLDGSKSDVLNNYYEAELNSYQRGTIDYPYYELSNGLHRLNIRVWDIYNNSASAYTEFIVAGSEEMAVNSLLNYPNPFKQYTTFAFEHNQIDQPLDVLIRIFSLDGRLVKTLNDIYYAGGYRYKSVKWNGTDETGTRLNSGMYVYKLYLRKDDGSVVEDTSKLIILK